VPFVDSAEIAGTAASPRSRPAAGAFSKYLASASLLNNTSRPFAAAVFPTMAPIIPAKAVIPFLVAMMLFTGVCNTLLTKYQVGKLQQDMLLMAPASMTRT
jgi:hypothetical protein